ncbi:MAG: peptide ABC transporter substrate-binding protein [Aliidongia sp.]
MASKWTGFGVAMFLALVFAVGPTAAETVLRRGNAAESGTLDPQRWQTVAENNVVRDLYEGLTVPRPGGVISPGQAESWTVSPDGKIWTFMLRPDLHWSNGDPLTAEDFVYSLRRQVDPAVAADNAFLLDSVVNATAINTGQETDLTKLGVEAIDPQTLRITLREANLAFAAILVNIRPAHRASIESFGRDAFKPGHLVSNGAYQLVDWQQQSRLTVTRNPHYWNAANVPIDRVEFYPIEDPNEELKRYRAGDLDITYYVPNDQIPFITATLGAEYHVASWYGVYYLGFNLTQPPFKDNLKLREALTLAIDRDRLVDKVAIGGNTAAEGWIPPGIDGYPYQYGAWHGLSTTEREAKARAAYQAAGYGPDHPLQVELSYNTSENNKKIMVAIAGMWKQVLGVQTRLSNQEFKTFLDVRRQKKTTQVFRAGYIGFYQDPGPLLDVLRSGNPRNDLGYDSAEFEALYRAGAEALDPAARLDGLAKAEARMLADLPVAPIYHTAIQHLIKPYVKGWQSSPLDDFRSQDLEIGPH